MTTREQVLAELAAAGLSEDELDECWIEGLVDFRKTGHCGSVNFSTVEFIPVISKCLTAVRILSPKL